MLRHLVFFIFNLFSLSVAADIFVAEAHKPLSNSEFKAVEKIEDVKSIKLLTNAQTEYFKRAYRISVDSKSVDKIKKLNLFKTFEPTTSAELASIDPAVNPSYLTGDPLFSYQWGLVNQKQVTYKVIDRINTNRIEGVEGVDINWKDSIDKIHAKLKKTPVVAVIDTGIDAEHVELKDAIYKNDVECIDGKVPTTDQQAATVDNDKNGLSGDCMGWNFAAPVYEKDGKQFNLMRDLRNPYDDHKHGTAVAGIIAAPKNENGMTGISSRIKILPIRFTGKIDASDTTQLAPTSDRIASAIVYAVNRGADVINISFSWPKLNHTKHVAQALNFANNKNVIIVTSAGNNSTEANFYPCAYYNVICVGSVSVDGKLSSFSNHGGSVDVLAPGDGILGTLPTDELEFTPKQINVPTYDIYSGTSYAAPFVSAMAALLKGMEPDITSLEVQRRIHDSSKAALDKKKSMNGLVDMKAMLELKPAPSVKPIFKQTHYITYNFTNGQFDFPLTINNFGTDAENVKVIIEIGKGQIRLTNNEFTIPTVKTNQIIKLKVAGGVLNSSKDNKVELKVTVSADGQITRSFYKNVQLSRLVAFRVREEGKKYYTDLATRLGNRANFRFNPNSGEVTDRRLSTFAFRFRKPKDENDSTWLPLGRVDKDGRLRNKVQTVQSPFKSIGAPDYHIALKKKDGPLQIDVFKFDGNRNFVQAKNTIKLNQDRASLIYLRRYDANYDGKDDYVVFYSACVENCEKDSKLRAKTMLYYGYYDENLNPLYGENSTISYNAKWINPNKEVIRETLMNSLRYTKMEIENLGLIAVPTFIIDGFMPINSQNQAGLTRRDGSIKSRLYYLKPELVDGAYTFETHVMSTNSVINKLKEDFGHKHNEEVSILASLSQSKEDFAAGRSNLLVSVGADYNIKNYIGVVEGETITFQRQKSLRQNLTNYVINDRISLTDNKVDFTFGNTFMRFITSKRMKMINMDYDNENATVASKYRYNAKRSGDMPLGFIASFNKADTDYSVFHTKKNLTVLKSGPDGNQTLSKPVVRFTGQVGVILNEIFTPVVYGTSDGLQPALYDDMTEITGNLISISTILDDKLINPINKSIVVPSNCKAMNPYPFFQNGVYSYSMLCKVQLSENRTLWTMRFLPLIE